MQTMSRRGWWGDERGMSLVFAIFIMIVLGLMAMSIVAIVAVESIVSVQHLDRVKAFFVAESGLERAIEAIDSREIPVNETRTLNIQIGEGDASVLIQPVTTPGGGMGSQKEIDICSTGTVPKGALVRGGPCPPFCGPRAVQVARYRLKVFTDPSGNFLMWIQERVWMKPGGSCGPIVFN